MGLRLSCAVLAMLAVGCVQPSFTKCPDVDCPKDFVCDGQGGCALPAQLAQCNGKDTGDACSYVDSRSNSIDGACSNSICLPIGCGNFIVTPNEVCDDGNTVNGDGCSADCQSDETCGNGAVDPARGEQCDDGNAEPGDGCQPDCKNPRCGDGITDVSLNEACDEGSANSLAPDAICRPSCQFPRCGDGVIDPSKGEICDDNNNNPNDGCAGDCKSDETCGNNVVDVLAGEVCDDGNNASYEG
jgi:cysteine-rich repeat protein